jgi:hypothetical protein
MPGPEIYSFFGPGKIGRPSRIDLPEIWETLTLRTNLCYFATCEKNGFKKRIVREILLGRRGSKTSLRLKQICMRHNLG